MTCLLLYLLPTLQKKTLQRGKALPDNPQKALSKSAVEQEIHSSNKAIMSDRHDSQNKPLVILSNSADYPRWKSYAMSEL